MSSAKYLNIAFYRFTAITDIDSMRTQMRALTSSLDLRGTIILAPEGINGFLAGTEPAIRNFQEQLQQNPAFDSSFSKMDFKESWSDQIPFGKLKIKKKKEIIPLGLENLDPTTKTGPRLEPETLKRWLDEGKEVLLVDTRNDYELAEGTFAGAMDLGLKTFREFPKALERVREEAKGRPVVMFCTGGIRCEKATAVAMNAGLTDVYQLEGGILRYFEKVGQSHYNGTCYVFDDRDRLDSDLRPL